jgi:hypothetical protein
MPDLPKPQGIPDNWIEKPTIAPGGPEYINPDNPNERVRVMPGNPNSGHPNQGRPYVIDQIGNFRDVDGNPIPGPARGRTVQAHIPFELFKFRR